MIQVTDVRLDRGDQWFEPETSTNATTLVAMTYGKCVYWLGSQQEKVILERGELLLIPAGESFYGKGVPTNIHEKYVVRFSVSSEPSSFTLPLLGCTSWKKSKVGAYDLILERFKGIYEEWQERLSYADTMVGALLLELLVLWNREQDRGPRPLEVDRHVDRMRQYIREHYRTKVTKEELGESIGKSPNHAATMFRRVTGQTISDFLHGVRIRTAMYMLNDSVLTISEISEFVGYSDVSYFQRLFKRKTGYPPSHFRGNRV